MIDDEAAKRRGMPAIIFDGDDTLWRTEPLYDQARMEAGQYLSQIGIDSEEYESEQRALDTERERQFGVTRVRFPRSSVDAAKTIAESHSIRINRRQLRRVKSISSKVFQLTATNDPNAAAIIRNLRDHFQIALLTKGDDGIQRKRLADSGLARYLDFASIVDQKDEGTFRYVLSRLQANPIESWSVGNSFRSDVIPSISIGMRAIRIEADAWPHEVSVDMSAYVGRYFAVSDLAQVPTVISRVESANQGSS